MSETTAQTPATGSVLNADALSTTPYGPGAVEPDCGSQSLDPNKSLVEANARYVQERDTARAELATAATRIERMQRAEVERLASERLSMGGDLFINGNEVSDYLTETGEVDADKVAADVAAVLAERPGLGKYSPAFDPSIGTGGRPPQDQPRLPTMVDLFKSSTQPY